ncbi:hypothetical protein C6A37_04000 [Desulfobacteraceae bacterium SEEP-SAG9]|nr:hypothetical protein C6A37_04000 [Desulfobacteraceae bacterium SEEP-SAG9]
MGNSQPLISTDAKFTIVENQKSLAKIIIPNNALPSEWHAAEILTEFVEKLSGAKLPILIEKNVSQNDPIISIGNTKIFQSNVIFEGWKKYNSDSFIVLARPKKKTLILAGKKPIGTIHAVCYLLKSQFGVKWYFPDELSLIIPKSKTLAVSKFREINSPAIPFRAVGWKQSSKWSLFNGNNVNLSNSFGVRVFKEAHTFFDFVPPHKYFKDNPEYFSKINGKRLPKQLCTSNPKVADIVVQNILKLIKEQPDLNIITLFPQDGSGFCECINCRKLDETGLPSVEQINTYAIWKKLGPKKYRALSKRMLLFYLAVAEPLLSENKKIVLQVGAYNAYLYPPKGKFDVPKRMMIELCHGLEHNHPIDSEKSLINTRFKKALNGWRSIFDHVSIYEYYWKLSMCDLPFPILHSIQKDIDFYSKNDVKLFYTQFGRDYYNNGLNYYIASELLWKPWLDVWDLLEKFCEDFYGVASEIMFEYYMNFEKAAMISGMTLASPIYELDKIFSDELIAKQEILVNKAISSVKNKDALERLRKVSLSLEYLSLCMEYIHKAKTVAELKDSPFGLFELKKKARFIKSFRERNQDEHFLNPNNDFINVFLNYKRFLKQVIHHRTE